MERDETGFAPILSHFNGTCGAMGSLGCLVQSIEMTVRKAQNCSFLPVVTWQSQASSTRRFQTSVSDLPCGGMAGLACHPAAPGAARPPPGIQPALLRVRGRLCRRRPRFL
jgi:hypothetical protein